MIRNWPLVICYLTWIFIRKFGVEFSGFLSGNSLVLLWLCTCPCLVLEAFLKEQIFLHFWLYLQFTQVFQLPLQYPWVWSLCAAQLYSIQSYLRVSSLFSHSPWRFASRPLDCYHQQEPMFLHDLHFLRSLSFHGFLTLGQALAPSHLWPWCPWRWGHVGLDCLGFL